MRIPLSVSTVTLTTHEFAVADWVWSSYFTDCGGKISRLTHSGRKCKQKNPSPLIQACKLVVYINARTYAHINIHTSARRYASNRTQTQNTHTIYTYVPNKHIWHTGTNIHTNKHTNKNIYNSTTLKTKAHASTATLPHNPPKHTRPSPQAFTSKDLDSRANKHLLRPSRTLPPPGRRESCQGVLHKGKDRYFTTAAAPLARCRKDALSDTLICIVYSGASYLQNHAVPSPEECCLFFWGYVILIHE